MINADEIIERLHQMSIDDVEALMKRVLAESNIPYTYGDQGILFNGLLNSQNNLTENTEFQFLQNNNFANQNYVCHGLQTSINSFEIASIDDSDLDAA